MTESMERELNHWQNKRNFLQSYNVNIAAIHETKLTNKTKKAYYARIGSGATCSPQEQWRRLANDNQRHDPLRRQHKHSYTVSRSSSGAKRYFYCDTQWPTAVQTQHQHFAT